AHGACGLGAHSSTQHAKTVMVINRKWGASPCMKWSDMNVLVERQAHNGGSVKRAKKSGLWETRSKRQLMEQLHAVINMKVDQVNGAESLATSY
ncbi:hypothetical protein Dimus_036300, partial [Dionaea muscipula]